MHRSSRPEVRAASISADGDTIHSVRLLDIVAARVSISRQQDIMDGAIWRDPERVDDWVGELSKSEPVVVFCAYGFHVGCKTAIALREKGFDAVYMKGGHSGLEGDRRPNQAGPVVTTGAGVWIGGGDGDPCPCIEGTYSITARDLASGYPDPNACAPCQGNLHP
jgi:rhodanese-related sulfurtransferase